MVKKMTAFVVIFIMVAAMWVIPSSASTFTDSLFFNADFNSGSFNDSVGGVEGKEWYDNKGATSSTTPVKSSFKDDATINRKVLSFTGESIVFYENFDFAKFKTNFTLEAYVNLPKNAGSWGIVAGTFWNATPDAGIGFSYGRHAVANLGKDRRLTVLEGSGTESKLVFSGSRPAGEWIHLVYTHDGTNECYYENGKLVESAPVWLKEIPSVPTSENEVIGFRVGGFNKISQFCLTMDCAYVRVYNSSATESDVKALYEGRNQDAAVPSGNGTVTKPTNKPSNGNSGSNNSSNKTDNASTFDLGIVSLAAVTLSSAVVAKKRRR